MKQIRFSRTFSTLRSKELPSSLEEVPPKPPTPPQASRPSSMRPSSRKNTLTVQSPSDYVLINPPKRQSSMGALENEELMQLASASLAYIASTSPDMPPSPVAINLSPIIPTPIQMRDLLEGDVSTILIRRASTNHRRMVDQSLHDVFFEECQSVRIAAQIKTPLFQPPKLTAESGSMVARNKMTKRDSVLLKRQRSVLDATSIPSSGSTPRTSSPSKSGLLRNKSAGVIGSKDFRRRTLIIPSFSFFEEREERRRPGTADSEPYSSLPSTPNAVVYAEPDDQITFQTRREKAKRASRLEGQLFGVSVDNDEEAETICTVKPVDPSTFKELPPLPAVTRRSTFKLPSSRSSDDRNRYSLLRPTARRYSSGAAVSGVYAIGQGISNMDPEDSSSGSISKLHPGTLFRRSLTFIASKRPKSGYVTSLFNRSTASMGLGGDGDSSIAHTTRSEPPAQTNRLSASTPALQPLNQEPLCDWEVLPTDDFLSHSDARRVASESFPVPPLPPLPRHAHTLRPSKSTLRRRSSQMFQHLSTFNPSHRDS